MTYQETLDYMFNALPAYHLVGKAAYKADLSNTEALMAHLGHPERKFRSIHVAGTNGKGSVSHFLSKILENSQELSKDSKEKPRIGLYTSPHLLDFRERIRINGEMIPQKEVTRFIAENKSFFDQHELSFFEMTVGLAFDYFARQQVDIAVIEVGLGGRLDATNVITPLLSVITNIGLDHTQFLGTTLPEIAAEKAGIIKSGVPVVIGETHPDTKPVFERIAADRNAPIYFADSPVSCAPMPNEGAYQHKNRTTVLQVCRCLNLMGVTQLTLDQVFSVLSAGVAAAGLHGRWEQFGERPTLIVETAHNEDGVRAMLQKLKKMPYRELHLVYGCVSDKDYRHILSLIGQVTHDRPTHFHYTQPSVPRRLPVEELAAAGESLGLHGTRHNTVSEAINDARKKAAADDLILVTGSIFLVADALTCLRPE